MLSDTAATYLAVPNAILFTNGDNDTFPLWYMQEVEEIRQDVKIINLSLLNFPSYIRQLDEHSPSLNMFNLNADQKNKDDYLAVVESEDYENLISKTFKDALVKEKTIVSGNVISVDNDLVTIDVGSKSEGRVPLSEFHRPGQKPEINVGDSFEVFIENFDNANGETVLSREKAIKQKSWNTLQDSYDNNKVVTGIPFNRVKGGMSVDLNGVIAFLPGSQIDTRQIVKDTKELLNKPLDLMILKMDKYRGNIVVSRKAISDIELQEKRSKLLSKISEGSTLEGKVKNITDYGAFIDSVSYTHLTLPTKA